MNFLIEKELLLDALQKIQNIVEKKNTIQILGNILIIAKNKTVYLYATDLEIGMKCILPANIEQEGKITLSAKHFLDIVRELPPLTLEIRLKENQWIEMLCGKSKVTLVSLPAEHYPTLPIFEDKLYFPAQISKLIHMIDRTHFAASSDITHHHLNGVYFECLEKPMIRMIATEGHRLSYVDQDVFLMETDLKQGVVIPKKGLLEFRKLLVESDETVGISFDRGYLFVKFPHSYFFVRLIEGDYPDYRTVMPKELHPFMMTLHKVDFISALKRASLLTHEKSRAVHFKINTHTLTISASHSEIGETHEEVSIEYQGEPMEISFNAKYLLDNLAVLKSEKITFALKDRLSSGILKELSDPSHTYIVMPMRL